MRSQIDLRLRALFIASSFVWLAACAETPLQVGVGSETPTATLQPPPPPPSMLLHAPTIVEVDGSAAVDNDLGVLVQIPFDSKSAKIVETADTDNGRWDLVRGRTKACAHAWAFVAQAKRAVGNVTVLGKCPNNVKRLNQGGPPIIEADEDDLSVYTYTMAANGTLTVRLTFAAPAHAKPKPSGKGDVAGPANTSSDTPIKKVVVPVN